MTDLLPCPFCGGSAFVVEYTIDIFYVVCKECSVLTPEFELKQHAIVLWNTRTGGK